jgi:hypothetical protein
MQTASLGCECRVTAALLRQSFERNVVDVSLMSYLRSKAAPSRVAAIDVRATKAHRSKSSAVMRLPAMPPHQKGANGLRAKLTRELHPRPEECFVLGAVDSYGSAINAHVRIRPYPKARRAP